MYGLFYFVDGSVIAESTSIIQDAYINAGVTVTCKEDIQSQEGWIEVILPAKRRQDPKPVAAKLLFMAENYKEVVQKRVAFLKRGDIWSSSQSGQEKRVVKLGMTSGSQTAKIGEQLKRDLKQQPTRQLSSTPARYESDSDDTCCDIFDPPKKRKMVINTSEEEEDAIPQAESQRPGTVPAVFVELDEDSLKALKELPGLVSSLKTVLNKMEDSPLSSMISSQSESPRTGSHTGSEEDMVSLGNSLVQVPKRLYQRLSGRRMSLFTQELATLVFGRETLAKATLTGKGKKGELKEQLEPEKTNAIIDAVRERFPNTEVAEIRALLRRKCNNESYKASSNSSQS
ncbi:uncharacterized protein LOC132126244 [Carassius carassius]|uniref:uncharacterized protein LOC132126244 n=1 Tax=Carassius carassius TaxID=217509 RepID=UPI00286930DA|nr:uncharacterized protein LOC132126244 [Carassius carassius]